MKVLIYDIETLKGYFLVRIYDPKEDMWYKFGTNRYENTIDHFLRFTEKHNDYYWVGYNNLRFDSQVIEYIIRSANEWYDLNNSEISGKIWKKAQDIIDDANYDVYPEYNESNITLKQIDLFTIWHFNNKNRRVSLKSLEFAIDMENIEEMPFPHTKEDFTPEEIKTVDDYCKNDVLSTYQFYLITRGQTDLVLYKGEDKISDRINLMGEIGLNCLNYDNVKIGAEWNKIDYITLTGANEKELKPKKVIPFYGKKFKQFFPKHIKFQTKELQQFAKIIGETYVVNDSKKSKKQTFKFDFLKIKQNK